MDSQRPVALPAAGTKRKRDSKSTGKFYAVRIGRRPGIYHTWDECLSQVRGFPKATFKSFSSLTQAESFVSGEVPVIGTSSVNRAGQKFYAVHTGRVPGLYGTWAEVQEQIAGWNGAKHKAFATREDAEAFVRDGQVTGLPTAIKQEHSSESIEPFDGLATSSKKAKLVKAKKATGNEDTAVLASATGEYSPGIAPLALNAEDDFDDTITLDQITDSARYKRADEFAKTTWQASRPVSHAPVRIYTDGSALSNGKSSAFAGVGVYFGPADGRNISEPLSGTKQTNQRAELTAILRALEVAPRDRKIEIFTDSKYSISCITEWSIKWRLNNWINSSNKPVENKDLITKILDVLDERSMLNKYHITDADVEDERQCARSRRQAWAHGPFAVTFQWVKGHGSDQSNVRADELAVNGARAAREMARAI